MFGMNLLLEQPYFLGTFKYLPIKVNNIQPCDRWGDRGGLVIGL